VLVALVNERDALSRRAASDLRRLSTASFASTAPVLGEALFLLRSGYLRRRLRAVLSRLEVVVVEFPSIWWDEVFGWIERYEEHVPDLADAQMAILCSRNPTWRVWTYDREFQTTWRCLDGSRLSLATRMPAR
jgi:predicted nucleic acid-binding protein